MAEQRWGLTLVQMTGPHDIIVSEKRYDHRICEDTADIREEIDSGSRICLPIPNRIDVDKVVDDIAHSACEGAS